MTTTDLDPGADPRFADFDAEFARLDRLEHERRPLRFRLYGEVHELPFELPAAVPMRLARMLADGRRHDELSNGELLTLAADLFPAAMLESWYRRRISADRLGAVIRFVVEQLGLADEAPLEVLDGPPPAPFTLPPEATP